MPHQGVVDMDQNDSIEKATGGFQKSIIPPWCSGNDIVVEKHDEVALRRFATGSIELSHRATRRSNDLTDLQRRQKTRWKGIVIDDKDDLESICI